VHALEGVTPLRERVLVVHRRIRVTPDHIGRASAAA
jgi:hypothetical protein